jgi:hypothetical protein
MSSRIQPSDQEEEASRHTAHTTPSSRIHSVSTQDLCGDPTGSSSHQLRSHEDWEERPPRLSDLVISFDHFSNPSLLAKSPSPPAPGALPPDRLSDPSQRRPNLRRAFSAGPCLAEPISRKQQLPLPQDDECYCDDPRKSLRVQSPQAPGRLKPRHFQVTWLCTKPLPFYRIQRLQNPWNLNRSIKISRDGTELEPKVGETLIREWMKFVRGSSSIGN